MSDITISIREPDDPAAWLKPDSNISSDCAWIYLDLDPQERKVEIDILTEHMRGGTPTEYYYNRKYRIKLPDKVDASRLKSWVEENIDLIEQLFDGHSIRSDSYNNYGALTDNGKEALEKIRALTVESRSDLFSHLVEANADLHDEYYKEHRVPTHDVHLMEAGRYVAPAEKEVIEDFGVQEASNEQLGEIAGRLEEEAREEANVKLYNTISVLKQLQKIPT